MSASDAVPDWLERFLRKHVVNPAAEFYNLEAGPPKPKANQQNQRGLVLPGYKYLGPFNGLDKGEPVNKADAVALEHDKAYDSLLQQGDNPYLKYNHADAEFQEALAEDTSFGGNLGKAVFQAKKRVLEPFGLVEEDGKTAPAGDKRKQGEYKLPDTPPQTPRKKRPRPGSGSDEASDDGAQPGTSGGQPPAGVGSAVVSAGGGAAMDDASQGADGVGNASGDWHCDSTWMGDHVVTKTTRTWVLPSYNNHLYKQITSTVTDVNNAYFGYSTPWGYFDFNRFHCHFSPRDWQRLINNNIGFRPKALKVKVFNIQVKEVTVNEGTKTIANNLTSTIQMFADSEYQLPYVVGNATEGCLPAFPPQVFILPQYGYCTLSDGKNPTDRSAFYCLEYFPSQMLRTGNNFEFTFEFESVPFHSGFAPNQALNRLSNPLVDQYLWGFYRTVTGAPRFKKCVAADWVSKYKNWMPGPHYRTQGWSSSSGQNSSLANETAAANDWTLQTTLNNYMRPGPNGMCNYDKGLDLTAYDNSMIFINGYAGPGETGERDLNTVLISKEDETAATNPLAFRASGDVTNNQQNASNAPGVSVVNERGIYPGNVWMDRDVYLQGPIWAKIPDVEGQFHPSPHMGGFGLKRPPPMIFCKNTPVPADVSNFTEAPVNSFINQYSTGQITVEMVWELKKEHSKRWNPEIQYTQNYVDPRNVDFAPDSAGSYQATRLIGTRYLTKPL